MLTRTFSSDRGAGQQPLLQLPSVLHGVSGQSGLSLHAVQPLGQRQPRPPRQRIAAASPLQSLGQESPAAVGPGAVPQVGGRRAAVGPAGRVPLFNPLPFPSEPAAR